MGMTKPEILRKFDEIVAFAGVERYIDTPVKRYSSGMYVRLAFAVAAHLEPEILIIDEVLAVGDAEFQNKCLGKMKDVSDKEGRTVLFVSHNMGAVKNLCTHALLMKDGTLRKDGSPSEIIDLYLSEGSAADRVLEWPVSERPTSTELTVHSVKVLDEKDRLDSLLTSADDLKVEIEYTLKTSVKDLRVAIFLMTLDGTEVFSSSDYNFQIPSRLREPGRYKSVCYIPGRLLNAGNYMTRIDFDIPKTKPIIMGLRVPFTISELIYNQLGVTMASKPAGIIHPYLNWEVIND
jgi:lipopolysaccharide transport system ATP-binding protein